MTTPAFLAFYDFDGTLTASNIVARYSVLVRRIPSRLRSTARFIRLLAGVPAYLLLDRISRRLFNEVFFKEYRGLSESWLREQSEALFEQAILPSIYSGARELVQADKAQGARTVLVTGELDFFLGPVAAYFGFSEVIANRLVFAGGVATGEVARPLIAEADKVSAMAALCRRYHADLRQAKAYSDSFSDAPMLEAVGRPCAVNPDRRLRMRAEQRGWPVRNLPRAHSPQTGAGRGDHAHLS